MYRDFWLKFPDETAWNAVQSETAGCAVDVVGMIHVQQEEDGEWIAKEGWHVNLRTKEELPDALVPFSIPEPRNKTRVWA